uniref:Secreted protein n=1 Tax=Ditylenchus dipsaci TaxID=166011 RepID=A0A915DBJ4_9BILA
MLGLRGETSMTLVFVVFVAGIVVARAKSGRNFLDRKQTEIDGEDNRKGQIKSSGGELDALQDPFELAATRIRVSVQQLSPSQAADKDTSKTDSDLIAAPPNGPVATIALTPSSSIKHRPSLPQQNWWTHL